MRGDDRLTIPCSAAKRSCLSFGSAPTSATSSGRSQARGAASAAGESPAPCPARAATAMKASHLRRIQRPYQRPPQAAPLSRQRRREDAERLDAEPEPLAVGRGRRVEAAQLADPVEPV